MSFSPSSPRPGWVEGREKRAGVMRARAEEAPYAVRSSIAASGAFFFTDSMPPSMAAVEE